MSQLIKEFPNKKWSKRGVEDLKSEAIVNIEWAPSSGRLRTTRTAENVDAEGGHFGHYLWLLLTK